MSEPVVDSVYGMKGATNESLVGMANAGNDLARQELRVRLPDCMCNVLDMYKAAFSDQDQVDAVTAALDDMKRIVGISSS